MKAMLFFDDWMVERRDCLERVWGKPKLVKEIFTDYHPAMIGYSPSSVFYDERLHKYVMYTGVFPLGRNPQPLSVRLKSDDPYNWPNPVYDASVTPVWRGFLDEVVHEFGFILQSKVPPLAGRITPLFGTPLAEHGYIVTFVPPSSGPEGREITLLGFSEDGLHFTLDWEHPWRDVRSDAWNGVVWNERAGFYQMFTRPACADRRITIVTTTDFVQFSPPLTVLQPDALDRIATEFYSMPTFPYEDMFVGMLWIFAPDTFEERRIRMGGRRETQLAYSYNGVNWYRPVREPFIGIRDYGLPGGGDVSVSSIVRTEDNKLLLYAGSRTGEHNAYEDMQAAGMDTSGYFRPLLYEMRLDGFCSLKTWGRDGVLRTKTIIPQAGELSINVRTTAHTAVRVQMLDGETAQPIPGYTLEEAVPISGDQLFARPRWKERADISELIGKPVRIELAMREAEVFAIRLDCQMFIGGTPTETL